MVGELKRIPPIAFMNGAIAILFIVILAPFGLIPLAVGQCLVGVFWLGTMIWLQQRYAGLNWVQIARQSGGTFVAIIAMLITEAAIDFIALPEPRNALIRGIQVFAGVPVYILVLLFFYKSATAAQPLSDQRNS